MSKYNIDELVYGRLFKDMHTKSNLKNPNFIYMLLNKICNTNKIIKEVNSICKIIFMDDKIVFSPRYRRRILNEQSSEKVLYVRDYVRKLLHDLGFETYIYHERCCCSTIYLSLKKTQNKKRLQQLGNVFEFEYETPVLTQSILDSIKQNKR
jgi:hypothetical protein